jgi:hypothetical protein
MSSDQFDFEIAVASAVEVKFCKLVSLNII